MKTKRNIFITAALAIALAGSGSVVASRDDNRGKGSKKSATLDFNEETHLVFMREEEKLARDVYTKLGDMYPNATVFGNIDDSEQRHTDAVKEMLLQYDIDDPNTNDNLGIYTGKDYADYFTEKYKLLTEMGADSELLALYVGALIEELDMLDLVQCPKAIVEADNGIDSVDDCGLVYTDEEDVESLLESLLDGSKNHLRAYVGKIEAVIGEGNYEAQILEQDEVDEILGRD